MNLPEAISFVTTGVFAIGLITLLRYTVFAPRRPVTVCVCVCLCLWECAWMDTKCGYAEAELCPLCAGIYGSACVHACALTCAFACVHVCVCVCVRACASWS
jgi:hypothetical protein